jgi:hypothetical protein
LRKSSRALSIFSMDSPIQKFASPKINIGLLPKNGLRCFSLPLG